MNNEKLKILRAKINVSLTEALSLLKQNNEFKELMRGYGHIELINCITDTFEREFTA